jgi:hypothetical protein
LRSWRITSHGTAATYRKIPPEAGRMDTPQKCAHPACTCSVTKGGKWGKYCSEYCKEKGQQTELRCECRHPGCA